MDAATVEFLRKRLQDDKLVNESLAMIAVSLEKGDSPTEAMRKAIADFILESVKAVAFTKN